MKAVFLINDFLTGPVMVTLLILVGAVLTFKTNFVQIRRFFLVMKTTLGGIFKKGDGKGVTPFQAVTTALSGTIGTGNIAGVATAVSIGGAGAIFWMWVSAFFGMAIKYSEIVLAMKFRKKERGGFVGGPMYYIRKATGGELFPKLFSVSCIFSSFFIGNMIQSNTAIKALKSSFNLSDNMCKAVSLAIAFAVGLVILGGINRIAKVTEFLIPFMALFYVGGCFAVIFMNFGRIGEAFAEIFASAFSPESLSGGLLGVLFSKSAKVGVSKGIFTNEAGLGSAPIAHAASSNSEPANQGMWGIFEVFFDTIFMCTLTGLVIILSGASEIASMEGAELTLFAFSKYLGSFSIYLLSISTALFAVASIIGWSYYGETCVSYLSKKPSAKFLYKIVYIVFIYIGAVVGSNVLWEISDILNGMMMIPNLIALILLSNLVKDETKAYFNRLF